MSTNIIIHDGILTLINLTTLVMSYITLNLKGDISELISESLS